MTNSLTIHITTQELCEHMNISAEVICEIVEHGIVTPEGQSPNDWQFAPALVSITRRATRLHRDLGIDWSGVALILDLLEERDNLKSENAMLRQRLARFLTDEW